MKFTRIIAAVSLCFCITALHAQDDDATNQGFFSFGATMSDYTSLTHSKYSTASKNNFGIQLSYWQPVIPHINFSANLGVVMANFPAGFIKGDSTGRSGLTMHGDALFHIMAFARNTMVNPFVTAGAGWGAFGYQQAFYAPLGAGVTFHFNAGSMIILQGQMRKALSSGITNDFMFFSASYAHGIGNKKPKKQKENDDAAQDALASSNTNNTAAPVAKAVDSTVVQTSADTSSLAQTQTPAVDSDGDGVPDTQDKCRTIKGTAANDGCPFRLLPSADLVSMTADSVTYRIYFDFDRSDLLNQDFSALNGIMEILRADKTLKIHVRGYADMQGTPAKNMQISADRANVARDYFLSYGIPASRITVSYYGSGQPVDEVQQWRNRRVDVSIVKQ